MVRIAMHIDNSAELDSLASTLSLMVSLSNHEPRKSGFAKHGQHPRFGFA
jgi:hypothetical protein